MRGFPIEVDAVFREGSGALTADLTVYYCDEAAEQLCLIARGRLTVPLVVGEGGSEVTMRHTIPPPALLS